MDFEHFTAGPDDNGRRLDKIVRKFLDQQNLSSLYKSIRSGLIKVNDKKSKAESHVVAGDKISIASSLLQNKTKEIKPSEYTIPDSLIVFRNRHILLLNKPYNINVQKAEKSEIALNDMVTEDFAARGLNAGSLSFTPGPLHRLDKKTTGLIAFSQSLDGARYFSEGIKNHFIQKIYLGIVQGKMTNGEIWTDKIKKNETEEKGFKTVTAGTDNGDEALTEAVPLACGSFKGTDVTLVQFHIKTGRTHQIRSQTSLHGYPLIGDTAYKGHSLNGQFKRDFFLHACCLLIPDDNPIDLPSRIDCPPDNEFKKFLSASLINQDLRLNI